MLCLVAHLEPAKRKRVKRGRMWLVIIVILIVVIVIIILIVVVVMFINQLLPPATVHD